MDQTPAVERHTPREPALLRLARHSGKFFADFSRMATLTALFAPLLLASFLTIDIPFRAFDGFFGDALGARPSNWLTRGGVIMGLAPLLAILIARKFGGDEASRVVTASWGVAALAVFAELSYLAPALEAGDLPGVRFTVSFVAASMASQYVAANIFDVARGGEQWWRAPLIGSVGGALIYAALYFPSVYWSSSAPWLNWMVSDFAIKSLFAFAFLPVYASLRKTLRPSGGFGGR